MGWRRVRRGSERGLNILNCVVQDNDSTGAGCTSGGGQSGDGGIMVNGPALTPFRSEVRDNYRFLQQAIDSRKFVVDLQPSGAWLETEG